jgi:hypothetical protein
MKLDQNLCQLIIESTYLKAKVEWLPFETSKYYGLDLVEAILKLK